MEVIGQFQTPGGFNPWKDPVYPLSSRLGGHQRQSGRFKEARNSGHCLESNTERPGPKSSQYTGCALSFVFYEHYTKHF